MMSKVIRVFDTPYAVEVEKGKNYFWWSDGKSGTQPVCDGSHSGADFSR